jgi:serine/threonine protein kinase
MMAGKDLYDYIEARNFDLTEARARQISYQLGQAIQYLHNIGIVHRDLKLENVMMTDDSSKAYPKIVDFGLAKMIGPNE